jgi:hypothetical protein
MDESHVHARTLATLTALAEGVHPLTGEVFPADCPYHSPEIVRALYAAVRLIETNGRPGPAAAKPPERPREGAPANAGKPWNVDEDRQLLVEFDAGKTLKDIAILHQRTYAGIEARLEKLGRLSPEERTTSRRVPAQARRADSRVGG